MLTQRFMLNLIKTFHTVVFLYMAVCILYLWYAALARVYDIVLVIALASIGIEMLVWWFSGRRCPLTDLARRYGDPTGHDWFADIFLPRWAAEKIMPVSTVILAGAVIMLIINAPR